MNRKYRKTIVAGNWKMHKTATETKLFAERLKGAPAPGEAVQHRLVRPLCGYPCRRKDPQGQPGGRGRPEPPLGNQRPLHGEVSAAMLADLDVKYVIIGHSERRALFGETDLTINKNSTPPWTQACAPSCAWGEDLEQRGAGGHLGVYLLSAESRPSRRHPGRDAPGGHRL